VSSVLVLLAALPSGAEPILVPSSLPASSELSLEEVLSAADQWHPWILGANADRSAADAEALAARGGFDPVVKARGALIPDRWGPYPQVRLDTVAEGVIPETGVTVFGGYRLGQPLSTTGIQPYYRERETYPAGELRAGVVAPLARNLLVDRRRTTVARSELGKDGAGFSVEQQRVELSRLAATRYWEWVAAGARRRVAEELLEIAVKRDAQLSTRVQAGDAPAIDRQDNERAIAQRRAFVAQTQRGVEQAALELSLFLRDDRGQPVVPRPGQLPAKVERRAEQPRDESLEEALARRPDVARLTIQRRQQTLEVDLARNQLWPTLDLGLTFSQDVGTNPGTADPKLGTPEVELSALLEVPLLYRQPLGRLRAAEAALAKVEATLQLARERVSQELSDARSASAAAQARIAFSAQEVGVALALEKGERTKFELGDSTLLFVNLREQQTAEARLREIDALLDAQRAHAQLRAALGLRGS